MFLRSKERRGHAYYSVVEGTRSADIVRQKTLLQLGRLDDLPPPRRLELDARVATLPDPKVQYAIYAKLAELGHPVPRLAFTPRGLLSAIPVPATTFGDLARALRHKAPDLSEVVEILHHMGTPVSREELAKVGLFYDVREKTHSISLWVRRS